MQPRATGSDVLLQFDSYPQAEQFYHDLIGSLGAIVWEADAHTFQFTFVSSKAEEILGYPPTLWLTHDFWLRILHPEDREWAVQVCLNGLETGTDSQFEYRVFAADGTIRWLLDVVRLVRDDHGEVRWLRGIMLDVTAQKSREAEQHRFRAVVTHDLRNPLAVVMLNSDLLLTTDGALGTPVAREVTKGILRSAEQMHRLITDLIDEGGHDHPLPVGPHVESAAELMADAARMLRPLAVQLGIRLEVPPGETVHVWADRDRVAQVFSNLIGNAIRYTSPRGVIRMAVEPRAEEVVFSVSDTGRGIPPERLGTLFGACEAGGLGLSIARELVEAHGGRIWAESRMGAGSTFFFTLRRAAAPTSPAQGSS